MPSNADDSRKMNPVSVIWEKAKHKPSGKRLEQLVSKVEFTKRPKDAKREQHDNLPYSD